MSTESMQKIRQFLRHRSELPAKASPKAKGASAAYRIQGGGLFESKAAIVGMLTVRVEVTGFEPGVTDGFDKEQVGIGDVPVTEQDSCTAESQDPFTGVIVMTSVASPPLVMVSELEARFIEKLGDPVVASWKSSVSS